MLCTQNWHRVHQPLSSQFKNQCQVRPQQYQNNWGLMLISVARSGNSSVRTGVSCLYLWPGQATAVSEQLGSHAYICGQVRQEQCQNNWGLMLISVARSGKSSVRITGVSCLYLWPGQATAVSEQLGSHAYICGQVRPQQYQNNWGLMLISVARS